MSTTTADVASAAPSSPGGPDLGAAISYWESPRPGVPEKFLRAIRDEPWRGNFEPCEDHPLTEIEVEGNVPLGLEGTMFRNGTC